MNARVAPDWHALFAPLPEGAAVRRKPAATDGWTTLTIELSAGAAGLRHIMVTLAGEQPIAASDWVMFRSRSAEGTTYVHENVGGRLEPDGRFMGTRWRSVMFERAGRDQPEIRETSQQPPSARDVEAVQALVLDVLSLSSR